MDSDWLRDFVDDQIDKRKGKVMSKRINRIALLAALGAFSLLAAACGNQPGPGGAPDSKAPLQSEGTKPPTDKGDQVVTGGDLDFMNQAAPGGKAEVDLGRMAASQGMSKEVKEFGQKMVEDHSKANQELMQLAGQKKVTLPPDVMPKHKEVMEKLSKLKGADFDREYVKAMVEDHEKDVTAFAATASNGVDADVKAFAAKALPTLRMHLQMIKDIQGKMK